MKKLAKHIFICIECGMEFTKENSKQHAIDVGHTIKARLFIPPNPTLEIPGSPVPKSRYPDVKRKVNKYLCWTCKFPLNMEGLKEIHKTQSHLVLNLGKNKFITAEGLCSLPEK